MSLAKQLDTQFEEFQANVPSDIKDPIIKANKDLSSSFDRSQVIKPGDILPAFSLPDANGNAVESATLLAESALLITFYRGGWCPYCNLTLAAFQKYVDAYKARGVQFVAITPELPDASLTTTEKLNLQFPVLSDAGLTFARKLGIVFKQDENVRAPFKKAGIDLKASNGDDSFELPVPVTLLVDQGGEVKRVFLNSDFTKRLEPVTALHWIESLNAERN